MSTAIDPPFPESHITSSSISTELLAARPPLSLDQKLTETNADQLIGLFLIHGKTLAPAAAIAQHGAEPIVVVAPESDVQIGRSIFRALFQVGKHVCWPKSKPHLTTVDDSSAGSCGSNRPRACFVGCCEGNLYFCTCSAFMFQVCTKSEGIFCKHLLAIELLCHSEGVVGRTFPLSQVSGEEFAALFGK